MRDFFACLALGGVLGSSVTLPAQADRDEGACPHQVVQREPARFLVGNAVRFGSGVQWNIGGLEYSSPQNTCVLVLTLVPEHYTTKQLSGSNTYTEPTTAKPVFVGRYRCVTSHFLFIPIGSTCEEISFAEAYRVPDYVQFRCRE